MNRERLQKPVYKRILLKLGGEAFSGKSGHGIDVKEIELIAKRIKEVRETGVEVAVVTGGGNIIRGQALKSRGADPSTADYIGMMGTVINSLLLQDALERIGEICRVQTAIEIRALAEPYIRRRAVRHLEKGRIVVFAAGTGSPYFTTDTAAALRAVEIEADVILKATKVDGIYDSNPQHNPKAKRFTKLSHMEFIKKKLRVMDTTAVSLCMENDLPIIVFSLEKRGNIKQAILGKRIGTIIKSV